MALIITKDGNNIFSREPKEQVKQKIAAALKA